MTKGILALLLMLLVTPAHAEQGFTESNLRIHCDASRPALMLTVDPAATWGLGMATERIDVSNLVKYSEEDAHGDVFRLGTATVSRTCGRLSIKISGGFYNAKTQGEMGAAEDVPVVEIFDGDARIAGPLAIGACGTGGRYGVIADCPAHWATQVKVFESQGKLAVKLVHEYEEYLVP